MRHGPICGLRGMRVSNNERCMGSRPRLKDDPSSPPTGPHRSRRHSTSYSPFISPSSPPLASPLTLLAFPAVTNRPPSVPSATITPQPPVPAAIIAALLGACVPDGTDIMMMPVPSGSSAPNNVLASPHAAAPRCAGRRAILLHRSKPGASQIA